MSGPFIRERAIYRGLTSAAIAGVDLATRTQDDFEAFEAAVLAERSTQYVVIADVASFYQFVDHSQLELALVERTGRSGLSRSIRQLLDLTVGSSLGLPQGPSTSDSLSELVLEPVERRLRRKGLVVSRYSDDFRVGVSSWDRGLQAIQALQSELLPLGLVVNDEKTYILTRRVYESHVQEIKARVEQAFRDFGINPVLATQYSDDADDADIDPNVAEPAFALLERVLVERPRLRGFPRAANTRIIVNCLSLLGRARSELAFGVLPNLMIKEPPFSRVVGNYLAQVLEWNDWDHSHVEPAQVSAAADAISGAVRAIAPPWQAAWLFQALLHPDVHGSPVTLGWLRTTATRNAPTVIRARAYLALACQGEIVLPEVIGRYDEFAAAAQPDVVAAIAIALQLGQNPAGAADVFAESHLNTLVERRVGRGHPPRPWLWQRP